MREAETALAVAVNANDFGSAALNTRRTYFGVQGIALEAEARLATNSAFVYLGPRPFEPVAVVPAAEGGKVSVAGCAGEVSLMEQRPSGLPRTFSPVMTYTLEMDEDGERRIVAVDAGEVPFTLPTGELLTEELCQGVDVKSGRFEPAPDLAALVESGLDGLVPPPSPSATSP
ncbi:hypothetical protein [Cellulomonas phragmiteti]|uniref:hypothetical protein n=1 Tax=Cellulomonas phragmiteti TaxID=478780 RepID=UPI0019436518|nr:hypothetical protein [Cellulomonas phragmiteti]